MSELRKNLILFLASSIFSIILSEAIVRIFNLAPQLSDRLSYFRLVDNCKIVYELIPGSFVDGGIINQQGFRGPNFNREKAKDIIRIAMLGDSITQGLLVEFEKTFSHQLEVLLNHRAMDIGSNLRYEVMNFGVSGYNLEAEVETLKAKVLQYSPDIVILNFFHNDNEPMPGLNLLLMNDTWDEKQKIYIYKKYFLERDSLWNRFVRNELYKSKLYLFVKYRIGLIRNDISQVYNFYNKNANTIVTDKTKAVFYNNLLEIKRLKEKYHFKFLICIHPHLLYGEHPNNKEFAEVAKELKLPYFHMFEHYKKEFLLSKPIEIEKKDSCHPNALGHLAIAKAIFTELKKDKFIDNAM